MNGTFKMTSEQVEELLKEAFLIGWHQARQWPNHRPTGLEVTWREDRWPLIEPKPPTP